MYQQRKSPQNEFCLPSRVEGFLLYEAATDWPKNQAAGVENSFKNKALQHFSLFYLQTERCPPSATLR